MAHPVRTCAGCGRRAPQVELQRFGVIDGQLEPGPRVPGRGAYTCRNAACFRRAVERRAFARTLRRPVVVRPELERLYTDADG
jgi:N utilization substance protein A